MVLHAAFRIDEKAAALFGSVARRAPRAAYVLIMYATLAILRS
jgi:hypothetical protein